MKYRQLILGNALVLLCSFSLAAATTRPAADVPQSSTHLTYIRVVRVSFVQGDVTLRRSESGDWETAMLNAPIQQGFSIATGSGGFAEVEFENGSTARLGENGQIDFTQLAMNERGDKLNGLDLARGFATFHFTPQHHDEYTVNASGTALRPKGKAEFRADLSDARLRVEVFDGEVRAEGPDQNEQIGRNKVATYALNDDAAAGTTAAQISDGVQRDAWDKWTKARDQQAILATDDEGVTPDAGTFGWADLGTYGAWGNFPGYGYGWAPFEPAGWTPYSAGMWSNYPGWGYTWISAEPWGWLPFHNGFWNYDPAMGWFWMPGQPGTWSPALVSWYQGPGWVGWAPLGSGGRAVCAVPGAGCITAITSVALQNRQRLQPGSPALIHPASLTGVIQVAQPAVVPDRAMILSNRATADLRSGSVANISPSRFVRTTAPASVVIGHSITPDQFFSHHGFLSGPQVIRAPLGRTMGGVLPTVAGSHGELMPNQAFRSPTAVQGIGAGSAAARMPTVITRGSLARTDSGAFVDRGAAGIPAAPSGAISGGGSGRGPVGVSRGAISGGARGGGAASGGHR